MKVKNSSLFWTYCGAVGQVWKRLTALRSNGSLYSKKEDLKEPLWDSYIYIYIYINICVCVSSLIERCYLCWFILGNDTKIWKIESHKKEGEYSINGAKFWRSTDPPFLDSIVVT